MWSGPTSWVQPPSSCLPLTISTLEPMPRMSAPIFDEHPREVLDVGLAGGVADDRRAGRQRGGHQRVLGRHHRRLVHEDLAGAQAAAGRREHDVAAVLVGRAQGAEGVEVRVQAPAADDVAAGRRHVGAAEARQQRAGEQERRADALGVLAVDLRLAVHAGGADDDLVLVAPLGRGARGRAARPASPRRRGCAARCARRPRRSVRTDAARIGRAAFLFPAGVTVPRQRHAAVDDELLHDVRGAPRPGARSAARLG